VVDRLDARHAENVPELPLPIGRDYLRSHRWKTIKNAVLIGQPCHCHETVHSPRTDWVEDDDGSEEPVHGPHWQECRGALDYRRDILAADPEAAERALRTLLCGLE
jgi:hypothetical protein